MIEVECPVGMDVVVVAGPLDPVLISLVEVFGYLGSKRIPVLFVVR